MISFLWKTGSPNAFPRGHHWLELSLSCCFEWLEAASSPGVLGPTGLPSLHRTITRACHVCLQPPPSHRTQFLLMHCTDSFPLSSGAFKPRSRSAPAAGIHAGASSQNGDVRTGPKRVPRSAGRVDEGRAMQPATCSSASGRPLCCLLDSFKVEWEPRLICFPCSRLFICVTLCLLENCGNPLLRMGRVTWTWHCFRARHQGGFCWVFVWLNYGTVLAVREVCANTSSQRIENLNKRLTVRKNVFIFIQRWHLTFPKCFSGRTPCSELWFESSSCALSRVLGKVVFVVSSLKCDIRVPVALLGGHEV